MRSAGTWFVAAAAAALALGVAKAETAAEYLMQPAPPVAAVPTAPAASSQLLAVPHRPAASRSVSDPPRPAAHPPERVAIFAPTSAATARPLTAAQREEWRFLKDATAASRFEIDASRLALSHSTEPAVRSLADALIRHRVAATNELVHMLHMRGMAPPMLANDQRRTLNRLARLHGRHFDRLYIDDVALRRQQQDVLLFERAGAAAQDAHLKEWVERTLPDLREQLATAEIIGQPPVSQTTAATVPSGRTGAKVSKAQATAVQRVPTAGRDSATGSTAARNFVTRTSLPSSARVVASEWNDDQPVSEWNDREPAPALESIRVGKGAPGQ